MPVGYPRQTGGRDISGFLTRQSSPSGRPADAQQHSLSLRARKVLSLVVSRGESEPQRPSRRDLWSPDRGSKYFRQILKHISQLKDQGSRRYLDEEGIQVQ